MSHDTTTPPTRTALQLRAKALRIQIAQVEDCIVLSEATKAEAKRLRDELADTLLTLNDGTHRDRSFFRSKSLKRDAGGWTQLC